MGALETAFPWHRATQQGRRTASIEGGRITWTQRWAAKRIPVSVRELQLKPEQFGNEPAATAEATRKTTAPRKQSRLARARDAARKRWRSILS